MSTARQRIQIRRKKLAALIYDSRLATRHTLEDCSAALNIPVEEYSSFESGAASPSLPQLELLSLFLDVPLEHFWGKQSRQRLGVPEPIREHARTTTLRNRLIGASLRLGRTNANLSIQELAQKAELDEETLNRYELGEIAIPLPELELMASLINLPIDSFYDKKGPIGRQMAQQAAIQEFLELPQELREFIGQPVNRPYLELAVRLSRMDVQKLRSIAETLLEITY